MVVQAQGLPVDTNPVHPGNLAGSLTEAFKTAFGGHPAGVAIITADSVSGPVGITASSVASVSAEPPLLAFSLAAAGEPAAGKAPADKTATGGSAAAIAVAESIVVHLLTSQDLELARIFARSKSERFGASMPWTTLETGEPLLFHGGYALRCVILSRTPAGGSLLLAAQVVEVIAPESSHPPMVYHSRNFHALGESSKL